MNQCKKKLSFFCFILFFCFYNTVNSQEKRKIHYLPKGDSFLLKKGTKKFNRALYGTNTSFRIETGDLPEFALYLKGMGGNFKLGIANDSKSKWVTSADKITTVYNPGTMLYEVKDALLKNGSFKIQVIADAKTEAMIVKVETQNIPKNIKLFWMYGGANGKKFHRSGDIGADPESEFYLQPKYCINNKYSFQENNFTVKFGSESNKEKTGNKRQIVGYFPNSKLKLVEAALNKTPFDFLIEQAKKHPVLLGEINLSSQNTFFWKIENEGKLKTTSQDKIEESFKEALFKNDKIKERLKLKTPDKYINTLGSALAIAADGIWENPAYLHGAVAWRMHLNAWRGAYVATPLGWHNRAQTHFESYGNSQVLEPEFGPVVLDSSRNFARQKEIMGTAMFSRGYISRNPNNNTKAHHYDMNSVFINQLLRNFQWTGDIRFIKKMWPVIKRHIAWEKRNFDADNDGLYDAYATIWASDALQYSGGGVTYASAYNYSSNLLAASIATILKENPDSYLNEAKHILKAIKNNLWAAEKGVFAEYKDLLGNQLLHDTPGIWTIYHALDENIASNFEAYQSLRYIDTEIPHIPVLSEGLPYKNLQLIATSSWQPYTWSVNNVALAENLHTSLAYWQGNRKEQAYKLWKSALVESMYLGASPGGFQQLSQYDAIRGELYRDFADPIGMAARSLVEGLFGIQPNAINKTLNITPGFPNEWKNASIEIPDIKIDFEKKNSKTTYIINSKFKNELNLKLSVDAEYSKIDFIKINDKKVAWKKDTSAILKPKIIIESSFKNDYKIVIQWKGEKIEKPQFEFDGFKNDLKQFKTNTVDILKINDPQNAITEIEKGNKKLDFKIHAKSGNKTFFIQLKQEEMVWWQPIHLKVNKKTTQADFQNWDKKLPKKTVFDKLNLIDFFNSKVSEIFEQKYASPRPISATLQIPLQGIGNWCYPYIKPEINDSGLRKMAKNKNTIISPQNIPFLTPSDKTKNNISFVSQWNNYPKAIQIPLSGKSSHVYFMMAGTTNPMQSRFVNGEIIVNYLDGTSEKLQLKNPENWWPIEQDYFVNGLAFTTDAPKPPRVYLKTGEITRNFKNFKTIKGYSSFGIDGGAATLLDLPLDKNKTLKNLQLKAVANEVVIGLMSVTLIR